MHAPPWLGYVLVLFLRLAAAVTHILMMAVLVVAALVVVMCGFAPF